MASKSRISWGDLVVTPTDNVYYVSRVEKGRYGLANSPHNEPFAWFSGKDLKVWLKYEEEVDEFIAEDVEGQEDVSGEESSD